MSIDRDAAAALVRAAAAGDQASWDALVAEYGRSIWAIARAHGLSAPEAADVSQTTWLRLLEHIDRLRDPGSVGAWLATTARREAALQQTRSRVVIPFGDLLEADLDVDAADEVDSAIMREDTVATVRDALDQLPSVPRTMLSMLMQDDPLSYEEIADVLKLPLGSVGPTRGRALRRLRRILEVEALSHSRP